jgi:hypothetical protein
MGIRKSEIDFSASDVRARQGLEIDETFRRLIPQHGGPFFLERLVLCVGAAPEERVRFLVL